MAQSGHADRRLRCPLLWEKRTSLRPASLRHFGDRQRQRAQGRHSCVALLQVPVKIRPHVRAALPAGLANETGLKVGESDIVRPLVGADRDVVAALVVRAIVLAISVENVAGPALSEIQGHDTKRASDLIEGHAEPTRMSPNDMTGNTRATAQNVQNDLMGDVV